MFSSSGSFKTLSSNLKLSTTRLKLNQNKTVEMSFRSRKEIADLLACGKEDRARIRVEKLILTDFLVEAMEIVEMFCDLLLSKTGIMQSEKYVLSCCRF